MDKDETYSHGEGDFAEDDEDEDEGGIHAMDIVSEGRPASTRGKRSKKPNPLISPTEKCRVCKEPAAKHIHYGASTCFSCRAFFRRSIQNKSCKNYNCRRQGKCEITLKSRKNCQKCRFDKCLEVGMKPSWVLSEEERHRRFRKTREKKAQAAAAAAAVTTHNQREMEEIEENVSSPIDEDEDEPVGPGLAASPPTDPIREEDLNSRSPPPPGVVKTEESPEMCPNVYPSSPSEVLGPRPPPEFLTRGSPLRPLMEHRPPFCGAPFPIVPNQAQRARFHPIQGMAPPCFFPGAVLNSPPIAPAALESFAKTATSPIAAMISSKFSDPLGGHTAVALPPPQHYPMELRSPAGQSFSPVAAATTASPPLHSPSVLPFPSPNQHQLPPQPPAPPSYSEHVESQPSTSHSYQPPVVNNRANFTNNHYEEDVGSTSDDSDSSSEHSLLKLEPVIEITEDEVIMIKRISDDHDRYYKSVPFGEELIKEMVMCSVFGMPMSTSAAMTGYRLMIQRVTKVAQGFDHFTSMNHHAQSALLKQNADLLVTLRAAVFFDNKKKGLDQILYTMGVEDIPMGKKMIMMTLKKNRGNMGKITYKNFNSLQKLESSEMEQRYDMLLARVGATVCIRPEIAKLLSYIMLFSPDFTKIENRTRVENIQEMLINMMKRYLMSQYSRPVAVTLFANILHCIADLREMTHIKKQRALAPPVAGEDDDS